MASPRSRRPLPATLAAALAALALAACGGSEQPAADSSGSAAADGRATLLRDPPFAGLDVVTQDRAVYLGDFTQDFSAALGFGSPLSLPYALEIAVPRLAQAADGDPATAVEDYTG